MIKIGEFSQLAKTTVKTLRFYDEIGLFKPCFVDDNGYRYYEIQQLDELLKIVTLKNLGISLDNIKKIKTGTDPLTLLVKRAEELQIEIQTNKTNLILLKRYIQNAKKGEFMKTYTINNIVLPKCIVYYRHGIIDSMQDLVPFIIGAGEEVRKNNPTLKCAQPDYCFVTYGANEYRETNVEVEYAQAVEKYGKESENIKFKELTEQKAISLLHKGSYSTLAEAYAYALQFVEQNHLQITAPIRERYIDGCWNKENEEDYLTEIQIPIK